MTERRCPDCSVTMEPTNARAGGHYLQIDAGERAGVLGKLGVGKTTSLDAVCCPDCGLVRLYADLE